jgi:hypothetical protein
LPETTGVLSRRLAELLEVSESEGTQGQLPDTTREQATGLVEALRRRIVRKPDRDHRSLFDLDDRLIELMWLVEEAADTGGEISKELAQEIDTYLEACRLENDSSSVLSASTRPNCRRSSTNLPKEKCGGVWSLHSRTGGK